METEEQTGRIEMDDNLAREVIQSQASSIVDGWREALQNGIDSPGSETITLDFNHERSVIKDDGEGLDLTQDMMRELLTVLGKSSKRDDEDKIGYFGMGWGQVIAKGRTVVKSRNSKAIFDIEEWDLEYRFRETEEYVDGFVVEVDHYPDQVPDEDAHRWNRYEKDIKKRFKYVAQTIGKTITINGEKIDGGDPAEVERWRKNTMVDDDDNRTIVLYTGGIGGVEVYSNGIYVKNENAGGVYGRVVTKKNLDLNFARNDIKSGCPVWEPINDRISEMKKTMFEDISDDELTEEIREEILRYMAEDSNEVEKYGTKPVFRLANGTKKSFVEVMSAHEIAYARDGSRKADKLVEAGFVVLDQADSSTEMLRNEMESPPEFDVDERVTDMDLDVGFEEVVPSKETLNSEQQKRIAFAQVLVNAMDIDREVIFGIDDQNHAWTDGKSFIALTESSMDGRLKAQWMPQIFHIVCHEAAHENESLETTRHGQQYNQKFRDLLEGHEDTFIEIVGQMEDDGIGATFERYGVEIPETPEIHPIWKEYAERNGIEAEEAGS